MKSIFIESNEDSGKCPNCNITICNRSADKNPYGKKFFKENQLSCIKCKTTFTLEIEKIIPIRPSRGPGWAEAGPGFSKGW